MSFTTTSPAFSFLSAGPSNTTTYSTRPSSFSSTCSGDEVVLSNSRPYPAPIQRPKKAPKASIGLGLGLPSDVLSSSFRDPSEVNHPYHSAGATVVQPTKAELRALRVAALRGLGIFLDEKPRPTTYNITTNNTTTINNITTTDNITTTSNTTTTGETIITDNTTSTPNLNTNQPIPSRPLLHHNRPQYTRLMARYIARAKDEAHLDPTHLSHSPLPVNFPYAPASTPAPSSGSSPFPIDDRNDVIEVSGSPYPAINFHPFSPRDEREEGRYLPFRLLESPEPVLVAPVARVTIYETSS